MAAPFQDIAAPFQEMATPFLDACAAMIVTPVEATIEHDANTDANSDAMRDGRQMRAMDEAGVELTYLPGLGRQLANAGGDGNGTEANYAAHACRQLIRGALMREGMVGWEKLRGKVYASPEWRLEEAAGDDVDFLGYSAFENAIVAALLVSSKEEVNNQSLHSVEVALFDDYQ